MNEIAMYATNIASARLTTTMTNNREEFKPYPSKIDSNLVELDVAPSKSG